jgi:hypothetical protein
VDVQWATNETDESMKRSENDTAKQDAIVASIGMKSSESSGFEVDPDFLRYRLLSKDEFHQKMEKLEKRQLHRLRSSLSVSVSQKKEEQLPYDFTKPEKVTFKEGKLHKRERILRKKSLKSPFITRLPSLKLTVTPLAFGCEIPPMLPVEFDISCILEGSSVFLSI